MFALFVKIMYNQSQWGDKMLSLCLALLENQEDEPLFEEFYSKYNKLVFYIAKDKLNDHQLAEDCVQEVFCNFARNFHNIKEDLYDNKIEGLIRVVARNMAIDIYRKNRKHIANVVDADLSDFFSLSEEEFDVCDQLVLKQAIDNLPEEIKTVFYLKYVFNYSGTEIAAYLNISESLVRKRCMLGRQMAKKFIESEKR